MISEARMRAEKDCLQGEAAGEKRRLFVLAKKLSTLNGKDSPVKREKNSSKSASPKPRWKNRIINDPYETGKRFATRKNRNGLGEQG